MRQRNKIHAEVTETDILDAKRHRKNPAKYAQEILEHLERSVVYDLTFEEGVPVANRAAVQARLKQRFECWANSWIAPKCREIIAKSK